jgi:hypothetical protein
MIFSSPTRHEKKKSQFSDHCFFAAFKLLGTGTDKLSREGLIDWDTNEVNGGDSGLGLGQVACDESGDSEP